MNWKLILVSTALEHLNSDLDYNLDDTVHEYLQAHYAELPALINTTNKGNAENIAKLYDNTVIRVPKLQPLSEAMRNAFISKDLYEINVENLKLVFGNETNLALDVALKKDKKIYHYLLGDLGRYLQAVIDTSKTIFSNEYFIIVIDDILELENHEILGEVIRNTSIDCVIQNSR